MDTLPVILFAIGGGLLNNFRGGWLAHEFPWTDRHGAKRVLLSLYLSVPVFVQDLVVGAVFAIAVLYAFLQGWGSYFPTAPYRKPQIAWIDYIVDRSIFPLYAANVLGMALRGLYFTVPTGALLQAWWIMPLGVAMGPIYAVGFAVADHYPLSRSLRAEGMGGPANSELMFGAFLAGVYWCAASIGVIPTIV